MHKTFALIIEAIAVGRLERQLASKSDAPLEERFEYLLRRAQLLTVIAEETDDSEDRALAEEAWRSVRALRDPLVDHQFEESWLDLFERKYGDWKFNGGLGGPANRTDH